MKNTYKTITLDLSDKDFPIFRISEKHSKAFQDLLLDLENECNINSPLVNIQSILENCPHTIKSNKDIFIICRSVAQSLLKHENDNTSIEDYEININIWAIKKMKKFGFNISHQMEKSFKDDICFQQAYKKAGEIKYTIIKLNEPSEDAVNAFHEYLFELFVEYVHKKRNQETTK